MQDNGLHTAYISVGSNLGDKLANLRFAIERLKPFAEMVSCSSVYETDPVGYTDQPDFLNMVTGIKTNLHPLKLLEELQVIEGECGRIRTIRFGPRTLDLDLLLYDTSPICFQNLNVPHPRMWERAFVMIPLAELAPDFRAPGRRIVGEIAQSLVREGDVRYVGPIW